MNMRTRCALRGRFFEATRAAFGLLGRPFGAARKDKRVKSGTRIALLGRGCAPARTSLSRLLEKINEGTLCVLFFLVASQKRPSSFEEAPFVFPVSAQRVLAGAQPRPIRAAGSSLFSFRPKAAPLFNRIQFFWLFYFHSEPTGFNHRSYHF